MPPTTQTNRFVLLLVALLGLGIACARQGTPPGGPRDEIPPEVVATLPDSGAVGVMLDASLEIEFSESMRKATVIDWVLLSPPRDFGKRDWGGRRFRLSAGEDYLVDATYTVIVGTGCKDARQGNAMVAPYVFVFATGDSIDPGQIEGRLVPKGQTAHGTIVWAFDLERAAARTDTLLPDYIAQAASDSTFNFLGLRPGRRYTLAAHFDGNRDREFDADTEFLAFYPETLLVERSAPLITGIEIDFRDPRAPGSITGVVIDSTAGAVIDSLAGPVIDSTTGAVIDSLAGAVIDSLAGAVIDSLAIVTAPDSLLPVPVVADTLLHLLAVADSVAADSILVTAARIDTPNVFVVRAWPLISVDGAPAIDSTAVQATTTDTLGVYLLRNLDPGFWRVEAALDRNRNQRYDAGEPVSAPADSVQVLPLEKTTEVHLILQEES